MAILSTPLQYIKSVPPVTRFFTAATLASSTLYLWIRWTTGPTPVAYLTLVPGTSLFFPWTFATSALVEISIIELIISLLVIPASLAYFERLWGTVETLKFIIVCVTGPNIIGCAFNWIEFAVTRNAELFLYGMEYHGQMALFISLLVSFTQVIPEHQVQILGFIKARVKRFPMAYLTFSTIMTLLGFQSPYILIQFGWFVSWVYLRFYKRNVGDSLGGVVSYGDRSETFALTSWFPPFLHTPLSLLGNTVYKLATRLHLLPTSVPHDIESGGYSQMPGGARAEAERRRALALKALDQRLANSSSGSPTQSGISQAQSSRPSPAAPAPAQNERKPSPVEMDVADTSGSDDGRR
ncbi:eukaryotic integral membrane protein-domain-containing protein [Suillus fuscotomentosus]|uniref:Eukaryotic integral membrane protein-domain-containing protein n=1 Tax=Suillus fuscotomentosus TaxID=1912939 RepID=A0AAD4EEP7_9AGAM|nr:eukaryotic integral membrane protein-domain-containing protein [Suillus fuscotomentosus]KAG1904682.1 eukaryotic integral membrane protein-domain-containing protein [Suillus fuscotomentosus]